MSGMGEMAGSLRLGVFLVALVAVSRAGASLRNVTWELLGSEAYGKVAAFGDFNADKQTDIFIIRSNNELRIFLADQKAPYFNPKVKLSLEKEGVVITSVVPGDYDGDSQMDVLLTTIPHNEVSNESPLSAVIYWGQNQTLNLFLTTKSDSGDIQFETWENVAGHFPNATYIISKPKEVINVGQSVFADFVLQLGD
ncbi:hypothetical protein FKM82_003852 [Ascaphus truei]